LNVAGGDEQCFRVAIHLVRADSHFHHSDLASRFAFVGFIGGASRA
jgi:hypothetical protein